MKKKASDSSALQEMWRSYKVELLQTVVKEIRSEHKDTSLPAWQEDWFVVDDGVNDVLTLHSSWKEFLADKKESEAAFLKGQSFTFSYFPYEKILGDKGIYRVIELDCLTLIKLIQNYSHQKHGTIFEWIEDYIQRTLSVLDQIYGRRLLQWEQKKRRAGCGRGQQEAKTKRIRNLVKSLRPYVKEDSGEIRISPLKFKGLVDETFVGLEEYPRHYATIKKYREDVEIILGKKIVFASKKERQKGTSSPQKGTIMQD